MAKTNIVARTGNEAMAEAMRQINPDVVAAYPITPATEIVQIFAGYVADGVVDTEFVPVESEHSAMSACIGSSAAGGRTMTGTSSQGLALMAEMLFIAAGLRLPIVLADVNRALSSPINIHCDHSDTMMIRDAGWIQIFSENAQEAYDNMIQAVRIAETARIPVIVTTDGFIISHGMERIEILDDQDVKKFVGEYKPKDHLLNFEKIVTLGALDLTDYYFEHKRQQIEALRKSKPVIIDVAKEFSGKFGRSYDLFERYKLDDAELAIVAMGSTAGTAKVAIDEL
ncbi:MAG TPA: pyruvate ferredoxin oxidoreductase, partial [Candidatus Omnitrophota bacterium]|nr:pyruvate ferredoxin oxidoreductase [Candidatus Omnitrophota bacterium]